LDWNFIKQKFKFEDLKRKRPKTPITEAIRATCIVAKLNFQVMTELLTNKRQLGKNQNSIRKLFPKQPPDRIQRLFTLNWLSLTAVPNMLHAKQFHFP